MNTVSDMARFIRDKSREAGNPITLEQALKVACALNVELHKYYQLIPLELLATMHIPTDVIH